MSKFEKIETSLEFVATSGHREVAAAFGPPEIPRRWGARAVLARGVGGGGVDVIGVCNIPYVNDVMCTLIIIINLSIKSNSQISFEF
jgi:hypothetical protein